MKTGVPLRLLEKSVARFEQESLLRAQVGRPRPPRVIVISRRLGCGARKIARALEGRLGWQLWDKQILEVIASQSYFHYQARMLEALDERAQNAIDAFASSLVGDVSKHQYLHLLPRAIMIIAQNDAIIVGRGAHLLLPDSLRIKLVASTETRVKNLMGYESCGEEAARKMLRVSDRQREAFLRDMAASLGRRMAEPDVQYDLTINVDSFGIEASTDLILQVAGYRFGLEPRTVGRTSVPVSPPTDAR